MTEYSNFFEELTDEQLLFLIKYGKEDPFEVLMLRYYPLVGKAIQGYYLRGYDQEDFKQEARMIFFHAVHAYDATKGYTFGKFFQLALRNHIYSLIRKDMAQKRKIEKTAASLDGLAEQGVDPYGDMGSEMTLSPLDYALLNDQLEDYTDSLSTLERRVFSAYLKQEPVEKIALDMKITESQIKNALDRCKRKMKQHLDNERT